MATPAYVAPPALKDNYLSKAAAARILSTSLYMVGLLVKQGQLETVTIGKRRYITRRSIQRFRAQLGG